MKKIKLLSLLTLLTFSSLVGCGNPNSSSENEQISSSENSSEVSSDIKDDYKLTIVSPSGAPAIAIADLAYNYKDQYNFELNKEATILQQSFLGNELDVIIAPINLGATMYNKNGNYQLASMLTWGNLYFASRIENFTLESMNDQDVVFFGQGTINQYVVESILEYNNIEPKSISYLGSTSLTQGQLISDENTIALVAEPALSVAKNKVQGITSISVQELYAEMTNKGSYPQAGCFIRKNTIKEHKEVVDNFIVNLENSANKTTTNTEEISGYAQELQFGGTKAVLTNAIPNCNIDFVKAIDCKTQVETLFANALNYCGGKLPDEGFYYQK